jgi:RNA polymerase sigma factor (sigma-70 family)
MASGKPVDAGRYLETLFSEGTIVGLSDAQLLARFASGSDDLAELAFAALVARYGPMVLRVCRAVLGNADDAEDAFQATFLVLVKKVRRLWVRDSLGPWLHQVAYRTSCRARSATARRRRSEKLAARAPADRDLQDPEHDLGAILHGEVNRLPETYRAAVVLCLVEGMTPEKAAQQLGWPSGTVHSRLARGREQLRFRLARRGFGPGVAIIAFLLGRDPAVAVSATLAAKARRAAIRFAAGERAVGVVPATVGALARDTMRNETLTKLLPPVAALLILAAGLVSTSAPAYRAVARQESGPPLIDGHSDDRLPSLTAPAITREGSASPPRGDRTPANRGGRRTAQQEQKRSRRLMELITSQPVGRVVCLSLSPDGRSLAAGCTNGSVKLVDARTGEQQVSLANVSRRSVRGVAFVQDGGTIAGLSDDNQLRLWNVRTGALIKEVPALGDPDQLLSSRLHVNSLAASPVDDLVAVGGGATTDKSSLIDGNDTTVFQIRVLQSKFGIVAWSHLGRRGFIQQLAFSPDGNTLACATTFELKLWAARSGELQRSLKPRSGTIWAVAFSRNSQLVAGLGDAQVDGASRRLLSIWDARSGAILQTIVSQPSPGATAPGTIAFSPDGIHVAAAGTGVQRSRNEEKLVNHVDLWNVKTGALVWASANGELGQVASVVFAPDGTSLYCCDLSASTRIDAETGQTRIDLLRTSEAGPR